MIIKRYFALVAALLFYASAFSIPATPAPFTMTQPDGTELTLRLVGDEFFNCFLTTDGRPVKKGTDNFYYYIGEDGIISDIRVIENSFDRAASPMLLPDSKTAYAALRELYLKDNPRWKLRNEENMRAKERMKAVMTGSKWDNSDGHDIRKVPTDGDRKVLVILAQFTDKKFRDANPLMTFTDMLNLKGFNRGMATGSVHDFYTESSNGIYNPCFDVYGPVDLPHSSSFYGSDVLTRIDERVEDMIVDAVKLLDGQINYADYDTNGDGYVDNVYVYYAGTGQSTSGKSEDVWPQSYELEKSGMAIELDGVTISRYACSNEIEDDTLAGIGTFCHEFAHVLGLPDLYDTANNGSITDCFTPKYWSVLDFGPYLNNSHTPPLFSSYERYALEWLKPVDITGSFEASLLPMAAAPNAYRINVPGKPTEYFLFENRQRVGWDAYLPGHGMLVWHIDFNSEIWSQNRPNNVAGHQYVDIVEADDIRTEASVAGDTFPGTSDIYSFTSDGTPALKSWSNRKLGYDITAIEETLDGMITFTVTATDGTVSDIKPLDSPVPVVTASGYRSVTLKWDQVQGADGYLIKVYDTANFSSASYGTVVEGWDFKDNGSRNTVTIEGLAPEQVYGVLVYAYSEGNASIPSKMVPVRTKSVDFGKTAPIIYSEVTGVDGDIRLLWDNIFEAESYDLTVAQRSQGAVVSTVSESFDNGKPSGWYVLGSIDNNKYGVAAPSVCLSRSYDCLETVSSDNMMGKISFWIASQNEGDGSYIDVYSYDDSMLPVYVCTINNIKGDGENKTIVLPENTHMVGFNFRRVAKDAAVYLDDITIEYTNGPVDIPIEGYNALNVSGNSIEIDGLNPDNTYVAYVVAKKGSDSSLRSNTIFFRPTAETMVVESITTGSDVTSFSVRNGIIIPSNAMVKYNIYTIDGTRVASEVQGSFALPARGLYIIHSVSDAVKVLW